MIVVVLIALLAAALIGSLPIWPHSRGWGRFPSLAIALMVAGILLLHFFDVI